MTLPGFTAENSTYKTVSNYRAKVARNFGNGNNANQVYLQRPNKENTEGGKCHAYYSEGTIYVGYYDKNGWCCSGSGKVCVNCDSPNNHCGNGHTQVGGGILDVIGDIFGGSILVQG